MSLDNLFRVLGPLISLIVGIIWVKTELAKYGERIKSHGERISHLENGKFEETAAILENKIDNIATTLTDFRQDTRAQIQELKGKIK